MLDLIFQLTLFLKNSAISAVRKEFFVVDSIITNFHLPESTLIMLVCAKYGYENTMKAYAHAVEERYRFFSFGDAMLIQ